MKEELGKDEMLFYLEEINRRLSLENVHGEIIIAGGAALTLAFNARESTHDIDAIFEPKENFKKIIKNIAEENNLAHDWLNSGVEGFLKGNMESDVFHKYSNLTVSCLSAECLLALKLTSARTVTKDMSDSIFLMKTLDIKSEDELFSIIDKYTYKEQLLPKAKFFTLEAFDKYRNQEMSVDEQLGFSKKNKTVDITLPKNAKNVPVKQSRRLANAPAIPDAESEAQYGV